MQHFDKPETQAKPDAALANTTAEAFLYAVEKDRQRTSVFSESTPSPAGSEAGSRGADLLKQGLPEVKITGDQERALKVKPGLPGQEADKHYMSVPEIGFGLEKPAPGPPDVPFPRQPQPPEVQQEPGKPQADGPSTPDVPFPWEPWVPWGTRPTVPWPPDVPLPQQDVTG